MAESIEDIIRRIGPSRSSLITAALYEQGVLGEAARQRLSRLRPPLYKFPVPLLPKNETFIYHENQRNRDAFWANLLRDMRASGSVYGLAIDGLLARGGAVTSNQFSVISGAPVRPLKGQVHVERVMRTLEAATLIQQYTDKKGRSLVRYNGQSSFDEINELTDSVVLDALREWVKNIGFASYGSVAIRGEDNLQAIGPFMFDLSGASYLAPVNPGNGNPGFFVADVFSAATLDEHQIGYFVRKVKMLSALKVRVLPMLVAYGFTGPALTAGHAAGISMATPYTLFGRRIAASLTSLIQTLQNAAAYVSSETPDRLIGLMTDLKDIEGRAGNLRGILFELIAGYLARRDAVSIEMGVIAKDPENGKSADIDILKVTAQASEVTCIECKGKEPGGTVSETEVDEWLKKIPTIRAYFSDQRSFREAKISFQLWTSGTFSPDAKKRLEEEKARRLRAPIAWKDGDDVVTFAIAAKEKAIVDALRQHFLRHPLMVTKPENI
jgi:hypothetical protein